MDIGRQHGVAPVGDYLHMPGPPKVNPQQLRVAIYETNLIWSSRLVSGLRSLGHYPMLNPSEDEQATADVAIVNLGDREWDAPSLVPALKSAGVRVVVHAGHKERPLLDLGKTLEANLVVTNSELTHKLQAVLEQVF